MTVRLNGKRVRRRHSRTGNPHRQPASQPAADDPGLIEELPYAPELLAGAPAELRARIYAAFQVHALYRAQQHQATITATITDQTPGIIAALISDPRTGHDTANPERTNPPVTAIGAITIPATEAAFGRGAEGVRGDGDGSVRLRLPVQRI
jgi:hypothetical protein